MKKIGLIEKMHIIQHHFEVLTKPTDMKENLYWRAEHLIMNCTGFEIVIVELDSQEKQTNI